MSTRRNFVRNTVTAMSGLSLINIIPLKSLAALNHQYSPEIGYVDKFRNENYPELGYWFISPDLLMNDNYLHYLDEVVIKCPFTLVFLTARAGADFYDYSLMHPIFKKLVVAAHERGIRIGLQLWQNEKKVSLENAVRMLVDNEVMLDESGKAAFTVKAKFIRFPDRLMKTDLFKAYAFKKTGEGFYDPTTIQDITHLCKSVLPDKQTVQIKINGSRELQGLTAYVVIQEYCYQSSFFGIDEYNRYAEAIDTYSDIPFDGFALDEYGYKFVERIRGDVGKDLKPDEVFRGRWYSSAMDKKFEQTTSMSLVKTLFDGRYAPEGQPEIRMKAINVYMDFMRGGALIIEQGVYHKSREVFGSQIFNGIHDTYHNSLINDEIWANGISWWALPRKYGQTDEKTPTPIQLGIAMAHAGEVGYNQFYGHDKHNPTPVLEKALHDLRYGIRTHYHALNDNRPNRYNLAQPAGIAGMNKVEKCTRLLNKFNPGLPEVNLLIIFGIEALCNWYPNKSDRGIYDINDKMGVMDKCIQIWEAGYLNAVMPSDMIVRNKLKLDSEGNPVINGHKFKAILYLNPQYAREPEIKFLEEFVDKGGKLMVEGSATHNFEGRNITQRFEALYHKAIATNYSLGGLPELGLKKNLIQGGCKTENGAYVFTDFPSLNENKQAVFSIDINGKKYTGKYRGLIVLSFEKNGSIGKLAASGLKELTQDNKTILRFSKPVDIYFDKTGRESSMIIADSAKVLYPDINLLSNQT